jgi:hypothetical protein
VGDAWHRRRARSIGNRQTAKNAILAALVRIESGERRRKQLHRREPDYEASEFDRITA